MVILLHAAQNITCESQWEIVEDFDISYLFRSFNLKGLIFFHKLYIDVRSTRSKGMISL